MLILITDRPSNNGYIKLLIDAYKECGHTVVCDVNNFFESNISPDVVHIHWPERLNHWYPLKGVDVSAHHALIRRRIRDFKAKGSKIVHTVHNLRPHSIAGENVTDDTYDLVMSEADVLVHHCERSIELAGKLYSSSTSAQNIVCHHGPYKNDFIEIDSCVAKEKLGVDRDAFVILSFGVQRPHKNEHFIEEVYSSLAVPNKLLIAAGKFEFPTETKARIFYKIRNWLRSKNFVSGYRYMYGDISSEDLPYVLSAADVVFLGHSHGLNSGVLAMAATYSKMVVYPDIGCFAEALEGFPAEPYSVSDKFEAKAAIERAHSRICSKEAISNDDWVKFTSWKSHVEKIMNAVSGD